VTRDILEQPAALLEPELRRKLVHIRDVLERWEISGINRKLQMKPTRWGGPGEGGPAEEVVLILK